MVKRLHEYKRQILKLLHVVTLYNRIKADPAAAVTPCTVIFGAKAAPGYQRGQAHHQADQLGRRRGQRRPRRRRPDQGRVPARLQRLDRRGRGGRRQCLGADLAGRQGGLRHREHETGPQRRRHRRHTRRRQHRDPRPGRAGNFFLFGVTTDEAVAIRQDGYSPRAACEGDAELKAAIDALTSGVFSGGDRGAFEPVISSILGWDEYLVLADYRSYIDCHDQAVGPAWADQDRWSRMSILNTARSGFFSSDRTVRDYSRDIWRDRTRTRTRYPRPRRPALTGSWPPDTAGPSLWPAAVSDGRRGRVPCGRQIRGEGKRRRPPGKRRCWVERRAGLSTLVEKDF